MTERTLLLVDDDSEIVKTVKCYLQHEGYFVLVTYDGKDTLFFMREDMPYIIRQPG